MRRLSLILAICGLCEACARAGFDSGHLADGAPVDLLPPEDSLISDGERARTFSNNIRGAWAEAATSAWKPAADATIDTTAGTISGVDASAFDLRVVPQTGAGELAVIAFSTIEVPAGVTVRVTGSRALVLLAEGITIAGTLDLHGGTASDPTVAGPGGTAGSKALTSPGSGTGGGASGKVIDKYDGGGGGGGYGEPGGAGGASLTHGAIGGQGGGSWGPSTLVPLVGGSGGGAGGPGLSGTPGPGGGGGGAVELVALKEISISGGVNAGGGGGGGGLAFTDNGGAGGGGGSGGAILLEAPQVEVTGVLAANGGGGGGAAQKTDAGQPGQSGLLSDVTAEGGTIQGNEGGGGDGAAGAATATDGGTGEVNGGGGGGGTGRIRINASTADITGITSGVLATGSL